MVTVMSAVTTVSIAIVPAIAAAMVSVTVRTAGVVLSGLIPRPTALQVSRNAYAAGLQRMPQASILLAVLEQPLLSRIGFVAVPTVLAHRRVNSISIPLKLIAELPQMIKLFLLVSCDRGAGLRSFRLRLHPIQGEA
jgi:hypothetical protein